MTLTEMSEIPWVGRYPAHWELDRIKNRTTCVIGGDWGDDPESDSSAEETVVLRVADMSGIFFSYDNLTIRRIKASSFSTRRVTDRTLLLEKSGGGEKQLVGRAALPKGCPDKSICANFMAKIDFDESIDMDFINLVFYSLYKRNVHLPFVQQTTGIQNLNVTYFLASKLAFPQREEQALISRYVLSVWEKVEEVIRMKFGSSKLSYSDSSNNQMRVLLSYRDSLVYECVTGKRRITEADLKSVA